MEGGGISTVMLNYYREIWRQSESQGSLVIDFMSYGEIDEKLNGEVRAHGGRYLQLPNRTRNPIRHYKEYLSILEKTSYDVLHFNYDSGLDAIELWESRKRVPLLICHVHSTRLRYNYINWFVKPLVRRSYNCALSCSNAAGESLFGENADFIVLNNAIDTGKFSYNSEVRKSMRKKLGISDDTFCVGNVGRMNSGNPKNTGFLIKAYAVLHEARPNTTLVIIGDGDLMGEWRALADELGVSDSTIFVGFKTNVTDYMQVFDVFCFPSRWEGLGTVAIEAQAAGLPVLASDAVPKEVKLTDRLRFLPIGEGDKEVWVTEIAQIMDKVYNRETSREFVQKQIRDSGYDIAVEAEKLLSIYRYR